MIYKDFDFKYNIMFENCSGNYRYEVTIFNFEAFTYFPKKPFNIDLFVGLISSINRIAQTIYKAFTAAILNANSTYIVMEPSYYIKFLKVHKPITS